MATSTSIFSPRFQFSYRQGVILVLLAGTCWSTMGLGIRAMEVATVWQILLYRSCAMAPFLFLLISLRSGGKPLQTIYKAGLAGALGGFSLVGAFAGGVYAIQTTTVANAMFLFAAAPFIAALLGWLILGERVRKATWIAMVIAAIGMTIMVLEGIAIGNAIGNIAALLSALGFAGFTIALRWKTLDDMLPAVFLAGVFAIFISAFLCLITNVPLTLPWHDARIALAMGIFQLGLGLTLYTLGSKSLPAAELALLSMTEVVLGPFWVWLFMSETPGPYTLLGGAILMLAIGGNALSGMRRKQITALA